MANEITSEQLLRLRNKAEVTDLYNEMLATNKDFRKFVENTKNMTTEEIIEQYKIDIPLFMALSKCLKNKPA